MLGVLVYQHKKKKLTVEESVTTSSSRQNFTLVSFQ